MEKKPNDFVIHGIFLVFDRIRIIAECHREVPDNITIGSNKSLKLIFNYWNQRFGKQAYLPLSPVANTSQNSFSIVSNSQFDLPYWNKNWMKFKTTICETSNTTCTQLEPNFEISFNDYRLSVINTVLMSVDKCLNVNSNYN